MLSVRADFSNPPLIDGRVAVLIALFFLQAAGLLLSCTAQAQTAPGTPDRNAAQQAPVVTVPAPTGVTIDINRGQTPSGKDFRGNATDYEQATGTNEISAEDLAKLMSGQLKLNPPPEASMDIPTLETRAEAGDMAAQSWLGATYHLGLHGTKKDDTLAQKWLTLAAVQGDMRAQSQLALILCRDPRKGPDCDAAEHWATKAAEQGSGSDALFLMRLYTFGAKKDREQACYWKIVADDFIHDRIEVPERPVSCSIYPDKRLAVDQRLLEWNLQQANKGVVSAQYHLGHTYAQGRVGQPDPEQAYFWYGVAAKGGSALKTEIGNLATEAQKAVFLKLSSQQVDAQHQKIDAWNIQPRER